MSLEKLEPPFLQPVLPARYERNFIKQVVCELRFPILFDLNSSEPNLHFAQAMRKAYPHHSHQLTETEVNGSSIDRTHAHIFKSKNLDWSVTIRPSALSIETTKYTGFSDLIERVRFVVSSAAQVIDSDFFTRIGLRYINTVPMTLVEGNARGFDGWIRTSLVDPLIHAELGTLHEYTGRIAGRSSFGTYLLQHGLGFNPTSKAPEYFLDFDFAKENIEIEEVVSTLEELHANEFAMFQWTMGPKGMKYLGESTLMEM